LQPLLLLLLFTSPVLSCRVLLLLLQESLQPLLLLLLLFTGPVLSCPVLLLLLPLLLEKPQAAAALCCCCCSPVQC
jgi:hypothetical protein